ncbi:DUF6434 domain-containing protein [Xanthomonas hyacinthi]|nr:DUF6434 domain-containing protein [Xanthomonas hyacinthi]
MDFDWHNGPITRATPVDETYRNTQAVRRFLAGACHAPRFTGRPGLPASSAQ